ncbi:hypothetical protein CMV00_14195 [Elizabethkingia anophelis]|nr:hypothetical protein [Elizabethkingia anophelis]
MKNLALKLVSISILCLLTACSKEKSKEMRDMKDSVKTEISNKSVVNNLSNFDITTIPFSDTDMGTFPFFKLPRGLTSESKAVHKKQDRISDDRHTPYSLWTPLFFMANNTKKYPVIAMALDFIIEMIFLVYWILYISRGEVSENPD